MAVFRENRGLNVRFYFQIPKGTSLRGTASFDVFFVKVSVGERKNPKTNILGVVSPIWREETPGPAGQNFALGRNHRCKFLARSVKGV